MKAPFKPEILLENLGPEVKSYIYQAILEFEPFTTPETVVSVVAKPPLSDRYRIAISLTESGQTIQAEGMHDNVYEAIAIAKNKLVKTLTEIQDDVISNQDRHAQIQHALAAGGGQLH